MSEISPPPPPPPSTPAAPPAPPPTAVAPTPPPALSALPVGARLEAVIQATVPLPGGAGAGAGAAAVEVDTALGRLLIQTGFPLPATGPLQLQIQAKGPQIQLLITAIHGLAPQAAVRTLGLALPASGAQAGTATPGGPGGAPGTGSAPGTGQPGVGATGIGGTGAPLGPSSAVNLTVGAVVSATLLRPGQGPAIAPPGAPAVGAGGAATPASGPGTVATGPAAATGAAPSSAPAASSATSGGGQSAAPGVGGAGAPQGTAQGSVHVATAGTPASATGGTAAAPAAPGTLFSLRIAAVTPPGQAAGQGAGQGSPPGAAPPPTGGALVPGGTLTGIVTGQAQASGQVVVQTHAGQLAVSMPTPLSPGSAVTFEVLSLLPPAPNGTAHVPAPQPGSLLAGGWPALEEAVREVQKADPALAQHLIQAVLPKPGATLAANMLFFLVALTGGDLRAWIGDGPYRLLQRLNPGLLKRLGDDFGRIGRAKDEPGTSSDWRTVPIPIRDDSELQQIRLYMRRAGDDADEEDNEGRIGTRFVVDLDLSRLGRFQIDGLVYDTDKHMDMIVRTENKLPANIESGIRDIFQDASEVTGLKGGIAFQAAPADFVEIAPDAPAGNPVGLIV